MKARAKLVINRAIRSAIAFAGKTRIGRYMLEQTLGAAMENAREVEHGGLTLKLATPNSVCDWRAGTFSAKEPETLAWIDALPPGSVLWDIGANIGLYSVYAAKKRGCLVYAFEPSVFNLELLARNIFMNGLTGRVCIVPVALSDRLGASALRMTTTEWGGALSTFGRDFGWDGKAIRQVFEFQTIGLTMDDAARQLGIPRPDYIKMDVDGLEHIILEGGADVLGGIKGMLIEVNDDFKEHAAQCRQRLDKAGLGLEEKHHPKILGASAAGFQNSCNQIWVRR